jgi:hypothetical protein
VVLTAQSPNTEARSRAWAVGLVAMLALLSTSAARAASLQQVNNWGATGVPSNVQAAFGQAQGGGIVKAADQNGFILVVPSSGRCWDVVSNKDAPARWRRR